MYLTDYREQSLKDVITQIEPELFKKVTGLSVKDFETLCSIGLFDSEKMNQGIFGFRKYENSSLSYTGIDKHKGESIGGWDTVLRREEFEELYSKQQATITDLSETIVSSADMNVNQQTVVSINHNNKKIAQTDLKKKMDKILASVCVGTIVCHKKFGQGKVVWMDKGQKYIRVKFDEGEKQFPFPKAFNDGFLSVEQ